MPLHDVKCNLCGAFTPNFFLSPWPDHAPCPSCPGELIIQWSASNPLPRTNVHEKERAVVWENPRTGELRYPGRNDAPIPERYAAQGYQRREFDSLRSLDKFCESRGLINEKASYNSGNDGFKD